MRAGLVHPQRSAWRVVAHRGSAGRAARSRRRRDSGYSCGDPGRGVGGFYAASPQSRNPARGQQYGAEDRGRSSSNSWFGRSLAGGEAGGRLLLSRSVELVGRVQARLNPALAITLGSLAPGELADRGNFLRCYPERFQKILMRIAGEQAGQDLLGSVVPPTTFQWRLAERKARLTVGVISKIRKLSSGLW